MSKLSFLNRKIIRLIYQLQRFFKTKLHSKYFKSNFQFFIRDIIFSYSDLFFSKSISFTEKKKFRRTKKKSVQKKSESEFYFNNWVVNGFLIAKTIKIWFQLFEKYRSFLIFRTYLNVDNSHVFIENFSRAEKNLNNFFNKIRFTIFDENFTHFISKNHFSWKKFLKIVSEQQKNAIVQLVSFVFSAAFVVTSISTKKMLKHVTKKNSKFTFLQRTAEISFKFINDFQQYVKKNNSFETFHLSTSFVKSEFFVISKIKTTFEFD